MGKFADIVDRVEQVRLHFGMNKSRFAASFGMKSQTYNNFIGAQGSKPNIELLHGVVDRFRIHPLWLLTGRGNMFLFEPKVECSGRPGAGQGRTLPTGINRSATLDMVVSDPGFSSTADHLSKLDDTINRSIEERRAVVDRVAKALGHYLAQYPAEARGDVAALLEKIEQRLSNGRSYN